MNEAIDLAKKAASSRSTGLTPGESGTGKEIFAHAILQLGDSKAEPFVGHQIVSVYRENSSRVNCSARKMAPLLALINSRKEKSSYLMVERSSR